MAPRGHCHRKGPASSSMGTRRDTQTLSVRPYLLILFTLIRLVFSQMFSLHVSRVCECVTWAQLGCRPTRESQLWVTPLEPASQARPRLPSTGHCRPQVALGLWRGVGPAARLLLLRALEQDSNADPAPHGFIPRVCDHTCCQASHVLPAVPLPCCVIWGCSQSPRGGFSLPLQPRCADSPHLVRVCFYSTPSGRRWQ